MGKNRQKKFKIINYSKTFPPGSLPTEVREKPRVNNECITHGGASCNFLFYHKLSRGFSLTGTRHHMVDGCCLRCFLSPELS